MWFCSFPFGIAHHLAKSSRVVISGCWLFIIYLIGALVWGISLLRHCFAEFAFSLQYWNTTLQAFIIKIGDVASWQGSGLYICFRSIIILSGSSELQFQRFSSWWIWPEKRFRRGIFTQMKSDLTTRCCARSDLICVESAQMMIGICWMIVPSRVTPLVLLFVQSKLPCGGFWDLLCWFCGAESMENKLLMTRLLQTIPHIIDRGFSMVLELSHQANIQNFLPRNRASIKWIVWLAKGFVRITAKTLTITQPSVFLTWPLHRVTWLSGLVNWAKPAGGDIITQKWLNLSMLEWYSSKNITQSI